MPPKLPYDTNKLIEESKALVAQTKAQGATPYAGSSFQVAPVAQPITPSTLTSQQPLTPEVATPVQAPVVSPYAITPEETKAEDENKALTGRIADLTASLDPSFQTQARLDQEAAQDVAGKKNIVRGFQNKATQLQAEAQGIQLQLEQDIQNQQNLAQQGGANVTKGGLAPATRALQTQARQNLLTNAIAQYSNNASLAASQGDLSSALDFVDRAIQAEFLPKEQQLAREEANLKKLQASGLLTSAQEKRAEARQAQIDAEKAKTAEEKSNKTFIRDLMLKAQIAGADSLTLKAIESARTPEEAIRNAGNIFQETPKLDTQVVKLDDGSTVLLDTQTGKIIKNLGGAKDIVPGSSVVTTTQGQTIPISPDAQQWVDAINNGSVSLDEALTKIGSTKASLGLKNEIIAGINAQGGQTETKLTQMKQNVDLIDEILKGDSEYFGASIAPRSIFGFKVNPYYNSFKAKVDNLVASLTVDNLGLLKGPMSDKDIEFVKQLSSGLDIGMDEKTAKERLQKIKDRLQEKVDKATPTANTGVLRSPDGTQEVSTSDLTPQELQEARNAGWK